MDKRLQRLQIRAGVLRDLVDSGIEADLTAVLSCENLASEIWEEHDALAKEFVGVSTPILKKLARDFAKLSPTVLEILKRANQACFDARAQVEAVQRKLNEHDGLNVPNSENDAVLPESQVKVQVLVEPEAVKDDIYSRAIQQDLKQIELQAQSVRSLTENVALLVAHQADDAQFVSKQSVQARDDVVAGLGELADAKKKEAGKHTTRSTTVSAVIGGAVGLVGGPVGVALGAAAGAAVGAAIGSSIASLSRRSIDYEVRAFKEKFRVDIRPDGSCVSFAEAYENERWSLTTKAWSSDSLLATDYRTRWTRDEMGNALGPRDPSPLAPDLDPRAPEVRDKALTTSTPKPAGLPKENSTSGALLQEESEDSFKDEDISSTFSGKWRWAQNSRWMPDLSDKRADVHGWQYAFSFADGAIWYPQPSRMCFVRRRRWVREQVLDPQKAYHPERIALVSMERKRLQDAQQPQRRLAPSEITSDNPSLNSANRHLGQSIEASRAVLEELHAQGQQIDEASVDVAIANDASIHAERVARAVTMSGVFKNAFSSAPDATQRAILKRDLDTQRTERAAQAFEQRSSVPVGWDHPVDTLERLAEEQLAMSQVVHGEVIAQNRKLDALTDATVRGERRILRAKNMI